MAKSKLVKANRKIAEAAHGGFRRMNDTVTGTHQRIADGFVGRYLTKDGESVADAHIRLRREREDRRTEHAEREATKREEIERRHHHQRH
ncbi:hypothetical protein [Bifidobacterium sp. ESL0800]|uniref:hypothetical protein n=1 Tax=Bifidobacterium sp. ESL0800 TaxID=2983236 RepID=UPI0023F6E086|nr:hypothetical protein [Bifidobacterium sp. ESL0800]WEV76159.1 hypothetical protein OZX75_02940 [Bifidobacterium sp. ESL0800]